MSRIHYLFPAPAPRVAPRLLSATLWGTTYTLTRHEIAGEPVWRAWVGRVPVSDPGLIDALVALTSAAGCDSDRPLEIAEIHRLFA